MLTTIFTICFVLLGANAQEPNSILESSRNPKALSVFQVVRFPNIGCVGSSNLNGTCYTQSECTNKGGTNSGSCANGFGVCCTFTLGCGSTIAENCTYFQSAASGQPAGQCAVMICKCSPDICQLRLDFNSFVITGPNTIVGAVTTILNGAAVSNNAGQIDSNFATECLTDTFSVTGNGASPPVICGTNTGFHMYTDASNSCNTLMFELGPVGIGAPLATRQWNIKISQISCFSTWLPPPGCTQYFTGTTNTINSYNYPGGTELAYQQQNICMRRERGFCRLCVTPSSTTATDFLISAMVAMGFTNTKCCGYGTNGKKTSGFDCLVIPGAVKAIAAATQIKGNNFCGKFLVDADMAAASTTVCTFQQPFNLQFLTDAFTPAAGAPAKSGFKLVYFETTC